MRFIDIVKNASLFDSHCHLNDSTFDNDRDDVVKRAQSSGVEVIIDIGINIESSKKAIQNTEKYELVYASVGIDPENLIPGSDLFDEKISNLSDADFDKQLDDWNSDLEELAEDEKVLMVGETGLDNFWFTKALVAGELNEVQAQKSLERQERLFKMHCELSKQTKKPLTIHSRNAINLCLEILQEEKIPEQTAVFHSLTPDIDDDEENFRKKVEEILSRGYFIGVNGIITFKNAKIIRNVYKKFFELGDLEKMYEAGFIFETDAPFLAPEPKRGERNEPGNLGHLLKNL
ncbi:TatD family hydrolase [Candidatus Dojkabacteria bacterium]|nr:TatD family hydrolase [Candidatus Dojkabacteria bacterium]